MTLCPPINLHATHRPSGPRPAPTELKRKSCARNLFHNSPGDSSINELLAQEQLKELISIKKRYNIDILKLEQREQEAAEITGQRYPYQSDVTTISPKSCTAAAAAPPSMGAGVATSGKQISIAIDRVISNSSSDLASSTIFGQETRGKQSSLGLKRKFPIRKRLPKSIKKSYEISNINNNNNVDVDNGTSELGNAEQ